MPVRKPQPEVAFLAAALALLGVPVLMWAGLIVFGLAARVLTPLDRLLNGPASSFVLPLFLIWAVLVVAVVLILGVRLSRRLTRQ
jgi:hypothetical protein